VNKREREKGVEEKRSRCQLKCNPTALKVKADLRVSTGSSFYAFALFCSSSRSANLIPCESTSHMHFHFQSTEVT